MELDGKTVLVVGGAGKIGRVLAAGLAGRGAAVLVADADLEAARRATGAASGGLVRACAVDGLSAGSVRAALEEAAAWRGRLDAVVNCAYPRVPGYGRPWEELSAADFGAFLAAHAGCFFLVAQQAVAFFKGQGGGGSVVNLGSIYGVRAPRPEVYAGTGMRCPLEYAAAKAAVSHLGRCLARDLGGTGIRVNTVSPGGILAGQDPVFLANYRRQALNKGMLDAADLVGAVALLVSDAGAFINGQDLVVDDGFTL